MTEARLQITVNGRVHDVQPRPGQTLLSFLRTGLGLTGTKQGCESGSCGACTVVLDGVAVQSCQLSLRAAEGAEVETIEGLTETPDGAAVTQALIAAQAAQCGYCLPGIVANAVAEVRQSGPQADMRRALARNLCRCGTQHRILTALDRASKDLGQGDA